MGKIWLHIGLLLITSVALFYLSNHYLDGYLRSPASLAQELKSTEAGLYHYNLSKEPPFKYRLLFSSIVKTTYSLFSNGNNPILFYRTYKFWSVVFYTTSALTFFWLLYFIGYRGYYPLLGSVIFLLMPPMLLAFTLPVHTREDTLAYTLLFLGLIAMLNEKLWLFLFIAVVGVVTRETLLLLPLLYFVFVKDSNWTRKLLISGLPVLLWIFVRLFWSPETYDVWEGLKWNLSNLRQVAGFLVITYNVCWLSFLIHLYFYRQNVSRTGNNIVGFFYRSAPFVMSVILVTTFAGGIFNEIRLLYLASPWIIVLFLDFIHNNGSLLRKTFSHRSFTVYAAGMLAICVLTAVVALKNEDDLIEKGRWLISYTKWVILSVGYIFILLLFLPGAYRVFVKQKSST